MSEHTDGLLEVDTEGGPGYGLRTASKDKSSDEPWYVADVLEIPPEGTDAANAARLAAAWNACRGIPTTSLTPGLVGELIAALEARVRPTTPKEE